jgi:drug/metabolite transporter (DMT)-like permease
LKSIVNRRRPRFGIIGAVLLSILETALLTLHGYHMNSGDALVLGAALCRAILMTSTKGMTDRKQMDSSVLTIIQLDVVAVGAGVLNLLEHPTLTCLILSFWLITGYLAIFATMFAFFVQLRLIRRTSASRVAVLMSTEPVFSAICSVVPLREHITAASIVGGLCMW